MAKTRPNFWNTRTSFASACRSIGKASPLFFRASRSRQPHKFAGRGDVDAREREPFRHLVLHDGAFCPHVVKRHMGKTREDGVGNGQAAWNALEKKYNSNTKEARRAYHEYLHNAKMKSGDDPDDFIYTMDGHRERLKDMGQPVPDERYEDIILQALPAEYERVRTASYERRDFHLADIRRMMSACTSTAFPVRTTPSWSQVVGLPCRRLGGNSIIKCNCCGNPGHRQKNCVAWIAAQSKDGNQQTTRSTPLGRWKRKAGGGSESTSCSFHESTTHSDETCRRQQQQMGNNGSANWANQGRLPRRPHCKRSSSRE